MFPFLAPSWTLLQTGREVVSLTLMEQSGKTALGFAKERLPSIVDKLIRSGAK